ncbi:MAG: Hsp20/alpha crystallin family protein [Candidatus Thermoplasmatota archaeon]|nr:Hsp20/alpha crystallin family protein [Candidatus Thermoplasmatota archaeon]
MPRKERNEDENKNWSPLDDWFGSWPRRRRGIFASDIFDDLEKQFKRDWQYMNRIMQNAMNGETRPPEEGGPYIYGWSLRVGPDGKPQFREFGNVSPSENMRPEQLSSKREPLVDVVENEETITITAELPGVAKEDIELETTEDTLTINVDDDQREYYKEVELPAEVDTDSATATYQNGILDIELHKAEQKKTGTTIHLD